MLCKALRIFYFCLLSVSCWDIYTLCPSVCFPSLWCVESHHGLSEQVCLEHGVKCWAACRDILILRESVDLRHRFYSLLLFFGMWVQKTSMCCNCGTGDSEHAFTIKSPLRPLNPSSDGRMGEWWEALRKARGTLAASGQSFAQETFKLWNFGKIIVQKWHSL